MWAVMAIYDDFKNLLIRSIYPPLFQADRGLDSSILEAGAVLCTEQLTFWVEAQRMASQTNKGEAAKTSRCECAGVFPHIMALPISLDFAGGLRMCGRDKPREVKRDQTNTGDKLTTKLAFALVGAGGWGRGLRGEGVHNGDQTRPLSLKLC